jgi:hypothetical protein
MPVPRSLLRLAALASCLALPLAAGCSSGASPTATSGEDAITEVKQTPVKDQSIGNCWTYATTGWMESLVKTANGQEMNLSESYVSYWWWFTQIIQQSATTISEGGDWETAVSLVSTYGIMDEGTFIPEEATIARSARQASAVAAMNASLATGALASPEARANSTLVRAELDKAWGLDATVVKYLDDTFGKDVSKQLASGDVPVGAPIHRAKELPAKLKNATTGTVDAVTIADAIGPGAYAWSETSYPTTPTDRRQYMKRVQRALHAEQPVILSWYVDFNALDVQGRFLAPPAMPGSQGSHMVVMYDYEVTNVPGFGTLKAGVLETRPDALEAALSDSAVISFLRIKNSWGDYHSPVIAGYHDLYMKYLDGPMKECATDADEKPILDQCHDDVPFQSVVLPAGF